MIDKLAITGGNGFVGGAVQRMLNATPLSTTKGEEIDVRDVDGMTEAFAGIKPDCVIHLAAQTFVPRSIVSPTETFEINFIGTWNVLTALKAVGFKGRMLFVGSADVYGAVPVSRLPIQESEPLRPRSPYAVSKVAAEALCYQWSQTQEFDIVMVRPFNHVGPGQSDRFVISRVAKQLVEVKRGRRNELELGNLEATRDFTDVRDVVRAYAGLLNNGENGEVYNVCSGEERSIRSVLNKMLLLSGVDAVISCDARLIRASEQLRVVGSFKKLRDRTKWTPEVDFEQSLTDILDYWESAIGE